MPRYKRVLLKLSGEVLAGDSRFGLDFDAMRRVGTELAEVHRAGVELCMVVGGGNMLRGRDVEKLGIERAQADYMGMLGTVVNGTKVDGIYDRDPSAYKDAKFLSRVTYGEALRDGIEVMDASAFSLCRENRIPILVLNVRSQGTLVSALVKGERIGTIVEEEETE